MKQFLWSFFLIFGLLSPTAKGQYVQGYIEDADSKERLIGASISFPEQKFLTYTNQYGFFQQKLPGGKTRLNINFVGYEKVELEFFLEKDTTLLIALRPEVKKLETIEIIAEKGISGGTIGKMSLSQERIKEIPLIGGEADVTKALQLLPGVQGGTEGSSGLFVRGGSPDQNLILLDGAPVYNTAHAFGLFSVFNPAAIKDVSLYKGGIPAQYGERLSSVIDISLKEGNRIYTRGNLDLGLLGVKGLVEGPLGKRKTNGNSSTSYLLSGRRTFLDLFTRPFQVFSGTDNRTGFYFHDLSAKLNHQFNPNNQIFFSFYTSRDQLDLGNRSRSQTDSTSIDSRLTQRVNWSNQTAVLRWNKLISNRIFSKLSLYYSRYRLGADLRNRVATTGNGMESSTEEGSLFQSNLQEISANWKSSWNITAQHNLRMGLGIQAYQFNPGAVQFKTQGDSLARGDSLLEAPTQRLLVGTAYISDIFQLGSKIKGHVGVRLSAAQVSEDILPYIQPRARIQWQMTDRINFQAAYTQSVQFLHLLANSNLPLPVDLWVPSTERVAPATSRQLSAGVAGSLKQGVWTWQIEGFYKEMEDLITYEEGANFFEEEPTPGNIAPSSNWEDEVEINGKGLAYGGELLVQRNQGRLKGWLAYTLSWNWREFEGLNQGKRFPFTFDRRHDLSIVADFSLNEKRSIQVNWVFQSGRATTLPVGEFISVNGSTVQLFGERNSFRFPMYHRLDIGYSSKKDKSYGQRVFRVGAYNAYSRLNAYSVSVFTSNGEPTLFANSLFPILPYISIEWIFDKKK
ncbi:MAG: TonB-dependent receptor [Bacteroidia bacterium]|nr:TonB-dependent receptor [Bacteroidia bacterium]